MRRQTKQEEGGATAALVGSGLPPFATVERFSDISGLSRSGIYIALRDGNLKAKKHVGRTLIDVQAGVDWLRGLPDYVPAPRQ